MMSSLLLLSLLLTATFWIMTATIGDRDTVKNWLNDSGVYDNFVQQIAEIAQEEFANNSEQEPQSENVGGSVDIATLTRVAESAISPSFLQESIEKVIDGSYDWLEEKTPTIEFSINFTEIKNELANGLKQEAIKRSQELPDAPDWYSTAQNFTWIMVASAVVLSILVVLLSASKHAAAKHLIKSFATAGTFILVTALVLRNIPISLGADNGDADSGGIGENIGKPLIEQAIQTITGYQFWFVAIYFLIVALLVVFLIVGNKHKKNSSQSFEIPEDKSELPSPEQSENSEKKNSVDSKSAVTPKNNENESQ